MPAPAARPSLLPRTGDTVVAPNPCVVCAPVPVPPAPGIAALRPEAEGGQVKRPVRHLPGVVLDRQRVPVRQGRVPARLVLPEMVGLPTLEQRAGQPMQLPRIWPRRPCGLQPQIDDGGHDIPLAYTR